MWQQSIVQERARLQEKARELQVHGASHDFVLLPHPRYHARWHVAVDVPVNRIVFHLAARYCVAAQVERRQLAEARIQFAEERSRAAQDRLGARPSLSSSAYAATPPLAPPRYDYGYVEAKPEGYARAGAASRQSYAPSVPIVLPSSTSSRGLASLVTSEDFMRALQLPVPSPVDVSPGRWTAPSTAYPVPAAQQARDLLGARMTRHGALVEAVVLLPLAPTRPTFSG